MTRQITFSRDGSKRYFLDGVEVAEAEYRKRTKRRVGGKGVAQTSQAYSRPLRSISLGCHPSQVEEFNRLAELDGNRGVRFLPDGRAEFTSRSARARELRRSGLHDKDGGYGD